MMRPGTVSSATIADELLRERRASSTPPSRRCASTARRRRAPHGDPPRWKSRTSGSNRDIDSMSARSAVGLPALRRPGHDERADRLEPERRRACRRRGRARAGRAASSGAASATYDVGSAPIAGASDGAGGAEPARELGQRRGLRRHVRGAAEHGELRLEPVDDRAPGHRLRSPSTSFGTPSTGYAHSSDIRSTMRFVTLALTAVGTAPARSAVATTCTPSGRPSPSIRMKML